MTFQDFCDETRYWTGHAKYLLEQIGDQETVSYCKAEARKLSALGLTDDETGKLLPYDYWLHIVAETVYEERMSNYCRYCGEMEG